MEKVRHGTDMVQTPVFEGVCACIHTHILTHAHTHSIKTEKPITLLCLRVKCREGNRSERRRRDKIRDGDVKKISWKSEVGI